MSCTMKERKERTVVDTVVEMHTRFGLGRLEQLVEPDEEDDIDPYGRLYLKESHHCFWFKRDVVMPSFLLVDDRLRLTYKVENRDDYERRWIVSVARFVEEENQPIDKDEGVKQRKHVVRSLIHVKTSS